VKSGMGKEDQMKSKKLMKKKVNYKKNNKN